MSKDDASEIANKWIKLVDSDGNGTLDMDEFRELCTKLDSNLPEEKV